MPAQLLIRSVEGCPVEAEQLDLGVRGQTHAPRSGAAAAAPSLVSIDLNCPGRASGPDFPSIAQRLEASGHRHTAEAVRRIGRLHFPQ